MIALRGLVTDRPFGAAEGHTHAPAAMRALLLSALLLTGAAAAQPSVEITGLAVLPQGAFSDALGAAGGGMSAGVLYAIPSTPLAVGVEGSAALYGYERRTVPLSLTIPDVRVGVTTSNNLVQGLTVLRLQVPRGGVRPYVDGVAGLTYLFTQTSVGDDQAYGSGYEPLSSTNYDDAALTAGGGVGVLVQLYAGYDDDGDPVAVSLDARLRYLVGGEATYLGRGDIVRYGDGTVGLDVRRSRTDVLVPHLGVAFTF